MKFVVSKLMLFLSIHSVAKSAKILYLNSAPGRSHYILGSALSRALAEKGHDVTAISCFGEKNPPKNGTYRDIVVTGIREQMEKEMSSGQMNMYENEAMNPFINVAFLAYLVPKMLEGVLQHEDVQKLIHSKEKFDVVIVEQFGNDAHKALATHFKAPLITVSSVGANFWVNDLNGNPSPTSYIPDIMLEYSVPMSFSERMVNSAIYVLNELLYNLMVYPQQNKMVKEFISSELDLYDVLHNSSIVLMNSHPSIQQPVPYVPNMIDIGGFHVKPPKKLPKDLQEYLDNAKNGVIYFSMGSNLKSAQLPIEKREAILKTFSKLKQNILWKWEDDTLPGKPPNVKTEKWLPQQDILAHPNVKLFITHGGLLSTTETIYHGVPILAIPIFGDQKINANGAVRNGYGLTLPFSEISEEALTQKINEILNNQKYKENVKRRSQLFHDRIVGPMDTAIYWIEYVIRHRGAPHLRVTALDLPWYKYHLLDVISVIAVVGLTSLVVTIYVIKIICKKLWCKNKKVKKE